MVYLLALLAILVSSSLGFLFLWLLDRDRRLGVIEGFALSYGAGFGIIAIIMTSLSLTGISFNIFNILALFVLILVMSGVFSRVFLKHENPYLEPEHRAWGMDKLEIFFLGAIIFEALFAFFVSLIKPMESYDAVAHWAMKAKILYFSKGLKLDIFSGPCPKGVTITCDYPWLWPFAQNYIHNFIGRFDDFASKMLGPFFFVSCLMVFYSILRKISLKRSRALIFTFFLASIPHFNNYASTGYADLVLGFYYSAGFFYLYLWFDKNEKLYLFISAIFTALACYVKCEGILLAGVNALTFLSFILSGSGKDRWERIRDFAIYIFILALLSLPMFLLRQITCANLSNHTVNIKALSNFRLENFSRISSVMYAYQKQFFNIKSWNLTWVLFIISVFLALNRGALFKKELRPIAIAIGIIFFAHASVYIMSPAVEEDLRTLSRLLLHFLPLVIFFIGRVFALEEERYGKLNR